MSSSVGTKPKKKQLPISDRPSPAPLSIPDRNMESAILSLENACLTVLDAPFAEDYQNTESQFWRHIFMNIATPVSLALMESKGPRHFHYHYRHRPEDASILHPVLENPVDMLAQVCKDALKQCQKQLVGIQDNATAKRARILELALQNFIASHGKFKAKKA